MRERERERERGREREREGERVREREGGERDSGVYWKGLYYHNIKSTSYY